MVKRQMNLFGKPVDEKKFIEQESRLKRVEMKNVPFLKILLEILTAHPDLLKLTKSKTYHKLLDLNDSKKVQSFITFVDNIHEGATFPKYVTGHQNAKKGMKDAAKIVLLEIAIRLNPLYQRVLYSADSFEKIYTFFEMVSYFIDQIYYQIELVMGDLMDHYGGIPPIDFYDTWIATQEYLEAFGQIAEYQKDDVVYISLNVEPEFIMNFEGEFYGIEIHSGKKLETHRKIYKTMEEEFKQYFKSSQLKQHELIAKKEKELRRQLKQLENRLYKMKDETKEKKEYILKKQLEAKKQRLEEEKRRKKQKIKYNKEMEQRKMEQNKLEEQKKNELSEQLKDVDTLCSKNEFQKALDKLADIIQDAKRFHLHLIESRAKDKYKAVKEKGKESK